MSRADPERIPLGQESDFPVGQLTLTHGAEHTVAELLPARFATYVRIFHPFLGADPGPMRTWQSLAEGAGMVFHAEIDYWGLLAAVDAMGAEDSSQQLAAREGRLEEPAQSALFSHIARHSPDADTLFLWDLSAIVRGKDRLLYRASVADFREVQEAANRDLGYEDRMAPGPDYVWSADRFWVTSTDEDLHSTYVACGDGLALAIGSDPTLECLPVTLETRVDARGDRINPIRHAP